MAAQGRAARALTEGQQNTFGGAAAKRPRHLMYLTSGRVGGSGVTRNAALLRRLEQLGQCNSRSNALHLVRWQAEGVLAIPISFARLPDPRLCCILLHFAAFRCVEAGRRWRVSQQPSAQINVGSAATAGRSNSRSTQADGHEARTTGLCEMGGSAVKCAADRSEGRPCEAGQQGTAPL